MTNPSKSELLRKRIHEYENGPRLVPTKIQHPELTKIAPPEKQLTLPQAAGILKMSACNLRRHCANGTIEAIKLGPRAWIIGESALEAFRKQYPDDRLRRGRKSNQNTTPKDQAK